MNKCQDILVDDIIDIYVYGTSDLQASLPPVIAGLQAVKLTSLAKPLALISIREDDDVDMVMPSSPTLTISSDRQGRGLTYAHSLSAVVDSEQEKTQELIEKVKNIDVHLLYRRASGAYCLSYTYPECSLMTHEDNAGSNHTVTVKAQIKSASPLIAVDMSDIEIQK